MSVMIGETGVPLPIMSGQAECFDTEYVRNGTWDIFMFVAPLEGWRRAEITEERTREDWAEQVKKLVDEDFPLAEKIILVIENLNRHSITPCMKLLRRKKRKGYKEKLEIDYTPQHGSWLNMAEIELNKQGLSQRIPCIERKREEARAWNRRRDREACKINWRFTTADARIKLKCLYPQFE
jgi:hypothetical protein